MKSGAAYIFVIPAFAGFALLLAHLFYYRGLRKGALLLAMVAVVGFLKEHSVAVQPGMAEYHFNAIGPSLFHVPVVVVVGWFYATYIGWCFAEGILSYSDRWRGRMFATLSLALIATLALSFCVETTGTNMGWWTWHRQNIEAREFWFFNAPKFVLIGWAGFTLKVLLPYFIFILPRISWKKKLRWIIGFFVLIGLFQFIFHGIVFNAFVLAIMFTILFILPFKNTWKLDAPPLE